MARRTRVLDTFERALMIAYAYAYQTGWRHTVQRIPLTGCWRVDRTRERVRHRCNPARERELGRHSP